VGEDVEHRVRLSEVRGVEGLRHHDRASLAPLFAELQAAVLISDDTERKRLTIGGLLDIAEVDYSDEASGDLVISWYFSRMFTRMAAASDHWAILDRQTAFRLKSRYSMLLFQHISSLVNLDHVTSKTFTVAELRAVLGVEPEKHKAGFAELNRWAIQPAIEEISTESRFVLTATPRKTGRTVTSITIEWAEKPSEDRKALKAEMDRHSAGRKARRNGSAETVARSFPASGGIEFDPHWRDLKRAAGCNMDNTMIADKFRAWCAGKGLALDAQNIEQAFSSFCAKVGRV
jgi:Protein involved in initiation of plasmid replication